MSLKVNKENIFFILPESRYAVSDRIDMWMEEDFVLHATAKVTPETLTETQSWIIARNGMHSGINVFKDYHGKVNIGFTYWFKKENGEPIPKQVFYGLSDSELNEFNEFTMICDHHVDRKIECFVNSKLVGEIHFDKDEKQSYEWAFFWFG